MGFRVGTIVAVSTLLLFLVAGVLHQRYSHKVKEPKLTPTIPAYSELFFLASTIFVAFCIEVFIKLYDIPIPHVAFMLMTAYIWGVAALHSPTVHMLSRIMYARSEELHYIYTPCLMFTVAFCSDAHLFLKTLPQTLIIGFPVSLTIAVIFGIVIKYVITVDWSVRRGLLFGIVALPTFPRTVITLLKQHSTRTKNISVLLEGETLVTFIIADIAHKLLLNKSVGFSIQWYQLVALSLRFIIFGLLCGWIFGLAARSLIRRMYNNKTSIFLLCFTTPFFAFSVSEAFISGCGCISVAILGLMLAMERSVLNKDIERFLITFWQNAGSILNIVVGVTTTVVISTRTIYKRKWPDFAILPVVHLLFYISRFLGFFLFSPILRRIGYGMDFKNMIVCVWCGVRSSFSFLSVGAFVQKNIAKASALEFNFFMFFLYFLSLIINGAFTRKVLNFLGLTNISMARQINMNNCMKHISAKRQRTITLLKMDTLLADANWALVIEATTMKHPYQLQMQHEDEDEFFEGYRFTHCSDCKKDIVQEPTSKEIEEMTKEANMRVLKARKMCYSRQYENGMITKQAIQIFDQDVELAMDAENYTKQIKDMRGRFENENRCQRLIRSRAEKTEKTEKRKQHKLRRPRTYWRRVCYHIVVTNTAFAKVMLGIITVHLLVIAADMYYYPSPLFGEYELHGRHPPFDVVAMLTKIFTTSIYFVEFVMKILAYSHIYICAHGFRTYFTNFWDITDFIALIGCFLSLFPTASLLAVGTSTTSPLQHFVFRQIIDVFRIFRAVRLLRVYEIFYTDIIHYLDRRADSEKAFTYELGKSYVTAEQEILDMLPYMIDNVKIREEMKQQIEVDRVLLTKLLGKVQRERPWIAITVKTKQAIRTILNSMAEAIKQLKSAGWIDTYEHEKLVTGLGELYKQVNSIKKVPPSHPKVIFKEVPWMDDDEAIVDYLFENVAVRAFEPGQVVFAEGAVADGIYIVVTGLFVITYKPHPENLQSMYHHGRLPIVDYLSVSKYLEPAVDYIVSGNCIGELSTLTERPYNCTVTADAQSEVYVLSRAVLKTAMELSSDPFIGLKSRIWKEVSLRIALPLLMSIPAYQGFTQEQIKYALERAFIPDLSRFKIFTVTDVIENIVLIEGVVTDYNTRNIYVAPFCIPRTIQKLILPTSSLFDVATDIETKLLIIPQKDVDEYDVMLLAEETCELVGKVSSLKCLQHTVQERWKKRQRGRDFMGTGRRNMDVVSMAPSAVSSAIISTISSALLYKASKSEWSSAYGGIDLKEDK